MTKKSFLAKYREKLKSKAKDKAKDTDELQKLEFVKVDVGATAEILIEEYIPLENTDKSIADEKKKKGKSTAVEKKRKVETVSTQQPEPKKRYYYVEEIPPITNVVFSGGGAKGVIYPGVIQAFEEQWVVKNGQSMPMSHALEAVSGSSVGAMTAAFFAAGISGEDLARVAETDFESLFSEKFRPINKDGIPLQKFLDEKIRDSVCQYLDEIDLANTRLGSLDIIEPTKDRLEKEKDHYALLELKQLARGEKPDLKITFRHLALLRKLDPNKFKDLYVTTVCAKDGKVIIFSADETPEMPISLAARASASLPILFEPPKIPRRYLPEHLKSYGYGERHDGTPDPNDPGEDFTDGGYLNNIPLEVFQRRKFNNGSNFGSNDQNYQTLVCAFDDDNVAKGQQSRLLDAEVTPKFYQPSDIEKYIRNVVAKFFGKLKFTQDNTTASEEKYELIRRDYSTRVIPLPVREIEIYDFKKANEMRQTFIDRGKTILQKFFMNHYGAQKPVTKESNGKTINIRGYDGTRYEPECAHQTFDRAVDLLLAMPWNKLKLLFKQNPRFEGVKVHKIVLFRMQLNKILDSNLTGKTQILKIDEMITAQKANLELMKKHHLSNEIEVQEAILAHSEKTREKLFQEFGHPTPPERTHVKPIPTNIFDDFVDRWNQIGRSVRQFKEGVSHNLGVSWGNLFTFFDNSNSRSESPSASPATGSPSSSPAKHSPRPTQIHSSSNNEPAPEMTMEILTALAEITQPRQRKRDKSLPTSTVSKTGTQSLSNPTNTSQSSAVRKFGLLASATPVEEETPLERKTKEQKKQERQQKGSATR